jgi:transcriptional regulator with GAF, ATPase, and Fis domain
LFAGGEKLRASSFNLGPAGALVPSVPIAEPTAAAEQQLADQLLQRLSSFGRIESLVLARALARSGGNVSAAARLLGMRRGQVEYRLKKSGAADRPK